MLCIACGTGSLKAPKKSEAMQLKTSPVGKKTVNSSLTQDSSCVAAPVSSAVERQTSSHVSDSYSSTSSQESDEMSITKPQPPPDLFPSRLSSRAKGCLQPKVSQFLLVEGEMSPDEEGSTVQDVESVLSVSTSRSSDKDVRLSAEGTRDAVQVGSDVSSEPLTFHTDFSSGCTTVTSSDEGQSNYSKAESKSLDVNDNVGKMESTIRNYGAKDSELISDYKKCGGLSDPIKMLNGLSDNLQYLPVSTSTVVVNMVLSSVVTQPEDQNSTALETDAANHSQENSECDMSISDGGSTHEAPDVAADKELQQEDKSSVTELPNSDHVDDANKNSDRADDASKNLDCADDANKSAEAEQVPSSEGETRTVRKKSKSPVSEKGESHSKSGKHGRSRSRSSERRKRRSPSSEQKNERPGKQSRTTSATRSPVHSPQRESSRQRDRKRSRSSSRSRRRRSSSREHNSRTRRTSSSRSNRRRERSRLRSREGRKKRSRSRSSNSRRRSRSTDRGRRKRETRSRSRDRSRRNAGRDRRSSRDEDTVRRDDKSVRQVDRASSPPAKNHQSDRSRDSPRHQRRSSPSRSERVASKRDKKARREKSGNSNVERSVTSRQSDSDLSGAESSQQQRSHEEDLADNNRIAVISSSSDVNRRLRREEFESDEEPPADVPAAYDPSEPTEDSFRDNRNVSDHRPVPPHWVPPANQRMPMVDISRPPPGFPARLPAPPSARFQHRPPQEAVTLDIKSTVMTPNQFGVTLSDGGRPPPPSLINVPPPPLPRPTEVQPPVSYSRPLLTTPAGIMAQPPTVSAVRIPRGVNVDAVPLIVRGPAEPARLLFVPPGVGQSVRLEAASVVGLPRIVCPPPPPGTMPDLVRLPLGQPQPRPGSMISGQPFVSGNQIMIRPAPVVFRQVPEHRTESPLPPPQVIRNLPISQIPRMSAASKPLVSSVAETPFPLAGSQPTLPNMPVPPAHPSQPQPATALSSSSASSPSSGSQDAEDLLLERYSAKPEPPKSLFPSQKAPEPTKAAIDTQQKSPDRISEESDKSSDHSQPSQTLPVPDAKTVVTTSSDVVPTSASESLPSDPRLLVQFLLKQSRQSVAVSDKNGSPADDQTASSKPSAPPELQSKLENVAEVTDDTLEKINKSKLAYSPSQADYLGEDEVNPQSESVREMKVCCVSQNLP